LARPAGGGDAHVSTEFVGACVAVEGVGALIIHVVGNPFPTI